MTTAFVAGATGYTGRNIVTACLRRGIRTVAHVRPNSSSLEQRRAAFEAQGAVVDTSPWTPEGMAGALRAHRPDLVFGVLGTTAKRGKQDGGSYESVDYGLTMLVLEAAAALEPQPLFIYLSAAGAGGRAVNAYMQARVRVETAIRELGVPHLIARSSFITGEDREEDRPLERISARLMDTVLGALAAVGVSGPRKRLGSIGGPELGEALVRLATDGRRGVVEVDVLRKAGRA